MKHAFEVLAGLFLGVPLGLIGHGIAVGRVRTGWVSIATWWPFACYFRNGNVRQFWLGKFCISVRNK